MVDVTTQNESALVCAAQRGDRAGLAVVARHEALKHFRRRKYENVQIDPGTAALRLDAHTLDPVQDVEKSELCGRILEAVKTLPEKYREVFVLAHRGELTDAQMAEA